jgi:hypothetical protein
MNALTRSFAILLLGALPGMAAAAVYKWVDENGQVQYTQTPPPGGVQATEIKPPPEPADPDSYMKQEEALEKSLEERRAARESAAKEAAEEADFEKQKAQRCEAAKHRLAQAEYPRTNFIEPDGTQRRATEEERQQQIQDAQAQVKEFCE